MTPEEFAQATGAKPEVMEKLKRYVALLSQWQERMNLVGKSTMPDVWRRHILDSAQLVPLIQSTKGEIADIGSGAGFPGLVISIISSRHVFLIESVSKKSAFLEEVARETNAPATIINGRVEDVTDLKVSVVTARAVAPLKGLIGLSLRILKPSGTCFFLKGQAVSAELTEALKKWNMNVTRIPSVTDPSGTVLRIEGIVKKP